MTGRCIYGVDLNPMAAELARVALCLEALEPGKPLVFLDQNIRVGNSLLGTTPALLEDGLPDSAFSPIEGDDRKVATALRKQNAAERSGQHDLFSPGGIPVSNAELAKHAAEIARELPDNLEDLHIHQQRQALELAASAELRQQKLLADAWCAAFVQPKTDDTRRTAITQATLEGFAADTDTLESAAAEELVDSLARQYRFFHWHVEFPHIFRVGNGATGIDPDTGWAGGFSCVIGNPPWERVKLQEQEFFAARSPDIANAPNAAARKKLIAALADSDSPADRALYDEFQAELRKSAGWSHLLPRIRPLPADRARRHQHLRRLRRNRPHGHRRHAAAPGWCCPPESRPMRRRRRSSATSSRNAKLVSFLDFENEAVPAQPRMSHHSVRFCLLTVCGRAARVNLASFAFSTRYIADLPSPPVHDAARGNPAGQPEHRHHARCSGPAATPRSRSASTSASRCSGATTRRRTPGACRSCACSTWPTTRACSGRATSWNATAGR